MLDIRSLLTKHRIFFRDRGKNVSRGNLVISCPFCNRTYNKDHGEHLMISDVGEYYCFRNPTRHSGHNPVFLFHLLGIPSEEYKDLEFKQVERTESKNESDFSIMRFFDPAETNEEAIKYLEFRLFSDPIAVCKKFHLLTSKEGKWAGRLLIPLTIGFTGRAMRSHLELRYDAYSTEDSFFLFKHGSTSVMICEGAIDAMRVATVSSQFDVIGKCGNRLSPALLAYLREMKYISIWNAPDGDINFNMYFEETKILRSYCTYSDVKRLQLPPGKKDFGLMLERDTKEFLTRIGN
jgi:hypothetical protein